MQNVYKLKGVAQHYSWGGKEFIPELLGIENKEEKPFAEYWLGAHPNAPAVIEDKNLPLNQFVNENAVSVLGATAAQRFGSLPYLFKILDVRQMLSIQVHPSKEAATEEYQRENEKGIPLNAPTRNYKDENHKPELMVALSDFYLLHGFKEESALREMLKRIPQLSFLEPFYSSGGYKALYEEVMTMPQEKADELLSGLLQPIISQYKSGSIQKSSEHFWAARAALTFCKGSSYDRGIFSIYLFNLLHLKKGEGIYQPAGLPHAYLEGQNVEVMAASDNVLRAGLTDKHIDVSELLRHVKFEATHPEIIRATNEAEQSFNAPAEEFFLKKFTATGSALLKAETATIIFFYEGEGNLNYEENTITVKRGEAVLVLAGKEVSILPTTASLTFFSVTAPGDKN
jgi:mannose-6-phosphate isomerase